jgi:hypothetical protein
MDELTMWSGIDVHADSPEDQLAVKEFFRNAFLQQVGEAYPQLGPGVCYELDAAGPRGFQGSNLLTTFELPDDPGPQSEDPLSVPAAPVAWHRTIEGSWSLICRRVAETGPRVVDPFAIYLVGVNPPPGMDGEEREEFDEFYTNVHMPEVAQRRHCLRASRYELHRELRSPPNGAPQFLAVYELDKRAAATKRHIGGAYARGPRVWQRHATPWRLWYRLLTD